MKRKLSKKQLIIIISVVVIIAGVIGFLMWMARPQSGTIQNQTSTQKTTPGYTQKDLDGTYVAFSYSSKYLAKSAGSSNNDLEIHTLNATTQYDKKIIVSVSNLPDGQLTSNANYNTRRINSGKYTPRKVQVAGITADAWVKNDGTEQTIFIPRGNKVASIAFVTAGTSDDLTPEVDAFIKTFRWK